MHTQKVAVILSGCGALDGSEIHEATLALLALDRAGLSYQCLAPDILQTRVSNMATGTTTEHAQRNVLEESARIARGKIANIAQADPKHYAAMLFPGGFGAALNLSNFGLKQKEYTVQADVLRFAEALIAAQKPAGFICIAPVLAARMYPKGLEITIGHDQNVIRTLEALGVKHILCDANHCVVDKMHKVVSTPAYMLANSIKEVSSGIECLVEELVKLLPS